MASRRERGKMRMDAALDAMSPLGFPRKIVRQTVDKLLKVYGGNEGWTFIEDSAYRTLIEKLVELRQATDQDADTISASSETGNSQLATGAVDISSLTSEPGNQLSIKATNIVSADNEYDCKPAALSPLTKSSQPVGKLCHKKRRPCYGWISDDSEEEEEEEDLVELPPAPMSKVSLSSMTKMEIIKSCENVVDVHHSEVLSNETESTNKLKRPFDGSDKRELMSGGDDGNHSIKKRTRHNLIIQQQACEKVNERCVSNTLSHSSGCGVTSMAGRDNDAPASIDTSLLNFDELDFRGILTMKESLRLANISRLESNEEEQNICKRGKSKNRKAVKSSRTKKVDKSVDVEKCPPSITSSKYFLKKLHRLAELRTDKAHCALEEISRASFDSPSFVCKDLSGGQEAIPIPVTNMYDDPPVEPTSFKYTKSIQVASNVKVSSHTGGCKCKGKGSCRRCSCARLNGTEFPYAHHNHIDRLIEPRDIVFECGPSCGCGPDCGNRVSQKDLQYRLEVFRTVNKGWAVKTWDFIPSGAPVLEYVGVLRKNEELDTVSVNEYIFEIDCLQTINEVEGRERRLHNVSLPASTCVEKSDDDDDETMENVPEFCIDAESLGNVSRFINHSCEPNLFVQCVLSSYNDIRLARVVLFAGDDIHPYQELTYDYNYKLDSVIGPDKKIKQLPCHCGEATCRKRLY